MGVGGGGGRGCGCVCISSTFQWFPLLSQYSCNQIRTLLYKKGCQLLFNLSINTIVISNMSNIALFNYCHYNYYKL